MNEERIQEIFDELKRPGDPRKISWRVGSVRTFNGQKMTKPLAYHDSRDLMELLDDVVGYGNWSTKVEQLCEGRPWIYERAGYSGKPNEFVVKDEAPSSYVTLVQAGQLWVYKTTLTLTIYGVTYTHDGIGEGKAPKDAASDSFKRAGFKFGAFTYLYGIDSPWVPVTGYSIDQTTIDTKLMPLLPGYVDNDESAETLLEEKFTVALESGGMDGLRAAWESLPAEQKQGAIGKQNHAILTKVKANATG